MESILKTNSTKHLKDKSIQQSGYSAASPLKIINLNDDCLEEIFMYLNMRQLFNTMTTHPNFSNACHRIFRRKYKCREISIMSHQLTSMDLEMILKMLGNVIYSLRVTFNRCDMISNHLIYRSIIKYCSETLTEITFNHIESTMKCDVQFPNLVKLSFNQGHLSESITKFNHLFPKLRILQMFFCKTDDLMWCKQSVPALEEFSVAHHNSTFDQLATFLDLNRQLKWFTVYNSDRKLINKLNAYVKLKFTNLNVKYEVFPCYISMVNE